MLAKIIGSATALVVLVGVPVGAEGYARGQLDRTVRTAVQALAPGASVTRVEPHGRPFLLSLLDGEVTSAYVDIGSPGGTTTVILQRLRRDTGHLDAVLWFPRVAPAADLEPSRTPSGAYTPRGTTRLGGAQLEVSYDASVADGRLVVRPMSASVDGVNRDGSDLPAAWLAALTPAAVQLPAVGLLTVRAVSVGETDITVELQGKDIDTGAGHRATVPNLPS